MSNQSSYTDQKKNTLEIVMSTNYNLFKVGKEGNVYTASDEHRDYNICLHNEMAYLPKWPKLVGSVKMPSF